MKRSPFGKVMVAVGGVLVRCFSLSLPVMLQLS